MGMGHGWMGRRGQLAPKPTKTIAPEWLTRGGDGRSPSEGQGRKARSKKKSLESGETSSIWVREGEWED